MNKFIWRQLADGSFVKTFVFYDDDLQMMEYGLARLHIGLCGFCTLILPHRITWEWSAPSQKNALQKANQYANRHNWFTYKSYARLVKG